MCNETENAQIRPVCDAKIEADIANQRKKDWAEKQEMALAVRTLEMPKSERIYRLAEENVELSAKIRRLEKFLNNNLERFASEKQVELMRGQLKAMESYKRFLSCRIADLALSDFDTKTEESK